MKKTLLILSLIAFGLNANAQVFGTGTISLNSNFSADISIDGVTNKTTLTLVVPSNVWFSIGFGGLNMSSGADVFRSNGTDITDARSTGRFLPTADTQQDWSLQSNTVVAGVRTMIVTRDNNTGDSNDFIFDSSAGSLTLIWAHGSSTDYAYHGGNRGAISTSVLSTPDTRKLDFDMFPNPASDKVQIQLSSEVNEATIQFYDLVGRVALTKKITNSNEAIDVSNLTSGIYLLKIISNDKIGSQKFIKK